MSKSLLLISFIAGLSLASCSNNSSSQHGKAIADSLRIRDSLALQDSIRLNSIVIPQDTLLEYTGKFLAGLSQKDENFFMLLEDDNYWQKHKIMMDNNWARMTRDRLQKMSDWELTHFAKQINDTLPVFYPFSGPDFLHAHYVFPKTKTMVLAALEPIIEMPRIDTLSAKERNHFLDTLANSLRDIFNKSYFITTHMKKDFKKVKGVLPFFYVFMERSGFELLDSRFIYIDSIGTEKEVKASQLHWHNTPGVKITFLHRATRERKTLYYFSISIANPGIVERPGFVKFIQQLGPVNTFVKSASYLMHDPLFVEIKKLTMAQSQSIFQDDTGIPYRDFKNDPGWTAQFYGEYEKPVKDFQHEQRYQTDLDSAYLKNKNKVEPLPFSLGYHWGSNKQNYMLLRKVNR